MAPRFFVDDITHVITAYTEDDSLVAPSGQTAVLKSTVDAMHSGVTLMGGVWDGVAYTAPSGQYEPDDLTTDEGVLRAAVRGAMLQLREWYRQVNIEGVAHSHEEVELAHDFLAGGIKGLYLMAGNHRTTGNANWTLAQRTAAANALAQGASDITSAWEFFVAMQPGNLVAGPGNGPALWVNVDTGVRVALSETVTNTSNMHLDSDQLPNYSLLGNTIWIDSLS